MTKKINKKNPTPRDVRMVMVRYKDARIRSIRCAPTYASTIKNVVAGLGEYAPEEVEKYLTQYIDARRAGEIGNKPGGDGTIIKEIMCLQAALNWCLDRDILMPHIVIPFRFKMRKLRIRNPEPRAFFLKKSETYQLLDAALYLKKPETTIEDIRVMPDIIPRIYIFIMLGLDTAARYRTILDLKWEQVKLDEKKIHLCAPRSGQTTKRRPTIAMSERLYQLLKVLRVKNPNDIYVLGHNGSIRKSFAKTVKRAGLPDDITPHTLRHTFATLNLQKGTPPFQVAQVLGDNVQTVLRVYGHHCPSYTTEAVNAMA